MSNTQTIKYTASQIARGLVTIDEAQAMMPACRFELLPNGRCFWFSYRTGLQGSEA